MNYLQTESAYSAIKSAIFGHAVGDALGVPVEFVPRERLRGSPVTNILGFGSHNVPAGTWSDDTSMTLCTLESLTKTGKIDLNDIMCRFSMWGDSGYMTPHGKAFGIGRTTLRSIVKYNRGHSVDKCGGCLESDNGNGSLMRILPVILYQNFAAGCDIYGAAQVEEIHAVSALTHAHPRSMTACGIYAFIINELLRKSSADSIERGIEAAKCYYANHLEYSSFFRIFNIELRAMDMSEIKSSGYVVDTLEAAVWCALTTESYQSCVLKAVNLGDDTDTIAAVAGGLAGLLYGYDNIPSYWLSTIALHEKLDAMCMEAAVQWTEK
ncbi:MAG: ADP-ribosylglycohydrolase family protein [Clostridia bacterium]|nr:ADP-ribosylglycohydrolase family protein [Clostridia bacterium]